MIEKQLHRSRWALLFSLIQSTRAIPVRIVMLTVKNRLNRKSSTVLAAMVYASLVVKRTRREMISRVPQDVRHDSSTEYDGEHATSPVLRLRVVALYSTGEEPQVTAHTQSPHPSKTMANETAQLVSTYEAMYVFLFVGLIRLIVRKLSYDIQLHV